MNNDNQVYETNPWMRGFKVASGSDRSDKPLKADPEAVKRRRAIEESIEAREMLKGFGIGV